jgi:hypothetical protein
MDAKERKSREENQKKKGNQTSCGGTDESEPIYPAPFLSQTVQSDPVSIRLPSTTDSSKRAEEGEYVPC